MVITNEKIYIIVISLVVIIVIAYFSHNYIKKMIKREFYRLYKKFDNVKKQTSGQNVNRIESGGGGDVPENMTINENDSYIDPVPAPMEQMS